MLVNLPVKAQFGLVVHLGPVHAEVVLAIRIFGDHQRERDKVAAVHGPRFGDGEFGQIVGQSHPLTLASSNLLRRHGQRITKQREAFPRLAHVEANVGFHHRNHAIANLRFMACSEGSKGSVVAPKGIHEQRNG